MNPQDHVYVGVWTNFTASARFDRYLLTLPNPWSTVVLATLAILITHTSAKCWAIFRCTIFSWLTTRSVPPQQEYLSQLELVLRNSTTAISTSLEYLNIWWNWRRDTRRKIQSFRSRHIPLVILLGLFHNAAFIILGAFIPLALIDSPAKIKGDNCGYWPINIERLMAISDEDMRQNVLGQHARFIANGTTSAAAYVRSCYGPKPEATNCDIMINKQIPWTGLNDAPCPFAAGQCVGENAAFTMDTGEITGPYYGINTKSSLTVRRQSTCTPIIMEPYRCDNGNNHGFCHLTYNGANMSTLIRDDLADPYQVKGWFPHKNITVHPNLQQEVGNVSLIYISRNNLLHLYRTEDPVFKATEKASLLDFSAGYVSNWEDRVNALGCVEKLQLCAKFDGKRECSPWSGVVRGENGETGLESFSEKCDEHDRGLISLLLPKTPVLQTIGDAARGSGSDLIAGESLLFVPFLQTEIQTARGDEQWKEEVAQWFNIVLAISQLAVLYFPIGTPHINTSLLVNEMMPHSRFICDNVLINSFKHTTIRFTGLLLLSGACGLIMLICYAGSYASTWRRNKVYVLREWTRFSWKSPASLAAIRNNQNHV